MSISPEPTDTCPVNIRNTDVLPAPFTPNNPKHSPFLTANETLRIANVCPS